MNKPKNKRQLMLSIICFSIFGLSILLMVLTSINTITSVIGVFFHLCGMYFASKSGYAKIQQSSSPKFMDPYSGVDECTKCRYKHQAKQSAKTDIF